MKKVPREKALGGDFDRHLEPVLSVEPGEEFVVETEDCFYNLIRSDSDLPVEEVLRPLSTTEPGNFNPVAGPIYVNGAEKGDVLLVKVHDVIPAEQGVTCILPGVGPLKDSYRWKDLRGPFTKVIKHVPGPSGTTSDGRGILNANVSWDLHPHIGTIGVAPEREVVVAWTTQGAWGGNIDVWDVSKGNSLMLPVFVKGGLLFLGDVHASEADTEFYAVADESRAEVRLSCELIKGKRIPFPRVKKKDSIIQLCCSAPLEDAVTQAMVWLIDWMVEEYHVDEKTAYLYTGVNPDVKVRVYQMTKAGPLRYTVGVEIPTKYLVP